MVSKKGEKMDFYGRDFLKILDFSEAELRYMLDTAKAFKKMKKDGKIKLYMMKKN